MRFETYSLGSLCSRITSGGTPKSTRQEYYDGDIPWLNTKEINFNRIRTTERCISQLGLENSSAKWISALSVIVAMYGATAGKVAVNFIPLTTNQACCNMEILEEADFRYVYYYLKWKYKELSSLANGGAQQNLNAQLIKEFPILLPSLAEQQSIADILWTIDDKIELNQRINENLQQQAQALYKAWFVDRKEVNGFLSDICQYSKERIVVSSLDLDSYYSTENMLPEKAGAMQAAGLPTTQQTTRCRAGDVLVSNIRPYFKKIVYCYADCGCSTDVLCFTPKQKELSAYLYCVLYADSFFDFMVAGSKGTKMPRGDKQQIMTYPIYTPESKELEKFNCIVRPILSEIQLNREESKRLSSLRDALLPKLMSGEIVLQEA